MPIVTTGQENKPYFKSVYSGVITETELFTYYTNIYNNKFKGFGKHKIIDLSSNDCDLSEITLNCLYKISSLVESAVQ